MAWIRIEDEVVRLERTWDAEMAMLDPSLRVAGRGLLERMDLGRGKARSWPRLFAPWTSLYPLLQAEGLERADLHQATRLNLAHLALLVHAFIDDRRRDGQLWLEDAESAFSRRCFDLALERLNDEMPDIFPSDPGVRALLDEYEAAQAGRWPSTVPEQTASGSDEDGIGRLARGRAIHGYLAPLALILGAGASPDEAERHRRAYDELVTGLQWGDDAEDWEGDWLAGRQNLLVSRIVDLLPDTAEFPRRTESLRLLRERMRDAGVVEEALDAAGRCFANASDLHASSGCLTLAGMLRMLMFKVERTRAEFAGSGGRQG